jgi:hypothetical protein
LSSHLSLLQFNLSKGFVCGGKLTRLHGRQFATRRAAMDEVIDWLGFYNASRLHSTLGYVSPMTFEKTGPQLSNTGLPNSLGYGIRGTGARSPVWHPE